MRSTDFGRSFWFYILFTMFLTVVASRILVNDTRARTRYAIITHRFFSSCDNELLRFIFVDKFHCEGLSSFEVKNKVALIAAVQLNSRKG